MIPEILEIEIQGIVVTVAGIAVGIVEIVEMIHIHGIGEIGMSDAITDEIVMIGEIVIVVRKQMKSFV
jgi:hypothetical protein